MSRQSPTQQFIIDHANDDPLMLALQKNRYPEVDIDFALRQIQGRQRTKDKLPTLHNIVDWHYPKQISIEQCSSEATAQYKASLISGHTLIDLTGGFGIDTYFLSSSFRQTHYVEQQAELCETAKHNFALTSKPVSVHHQDSLAFLQVVPCDYRSDTVVYLDPARRNTAGGKVFRIADCTPDITAIYTPLRQRCTTLLLKLSPMLDLTAALRELPHTRDIHIVAVGNEVKEILFLIQGEHDKKPLPIAPMIHAINIGKTVQQQFSFSATEETLARQETRILRAIPATSFYLYEPNLAILKAGAYCLVAKRFNLTKLAPSTHLYASDTLLKDFPGRIFHCQPLIDKRAMKGQYCNIITRNYPLSAEELRKKLGTKDGGNTYVIGTRITDKPCLFVAERLQ